MPASLRIKQGVTTAPEGQMLSGVAGVAVDLSNSVNTGVEFWQYELVEVPFGSSVVAGVLASGSSPTAVFVPDAVPGTYRIKLVIRYTTKEVSVDYNSFAVPTPNNGWVIPAFGNVEDELKLSGNTKSYAAFIAKFMQDVDAGVGGGGSGVVDGTGEDQTLLWNSGAWAPGYTHVTTGTASAAMPEGAPVALGPNGFAFMVWGSDPWKDHAVGILMAETTEGGAARVQTIGLSKAINHLRWVAKPTSADKGKVVYAEPSGMLTLTPNPNYPKQMIGVVHTADDGAASDTTRILIYVGEVLPTVLGPTAGGTGLAAFAKGDILYASGTTTLSKLGIGSTGQTLLPSGGVPAWGFLIPQAQEGTTGQVYSVSGTAVKVTPPPMWWNTNATPSSTAPAVDRVTVTGLTIKPGHPVRVLTKASVVYNGANYPKVFSADALTVKGSNLDYRLCAYYKTVISGTTGRFQVYSEEACLNLIGESTTFDASVTGTSAALSVTALNGSGYTATAYASTSAADRTDGGVHRVSHCRTGVCTSYNASTGVLTFAGQAVPLTSGDIVEVWRGLPSLVTTISIALPGSYAYTTSQAIKDRLNTLLFWDKSPAIICRLQASHAIPDTGATQPKVALVNGGVQLVADGSALSLSASADTRVSTVTEMSVADAVVANGNRLELRVVGGSGITPPGDLSAVVTAVFEG